ncbi:MAG: carboxypeptidase-like regulatory domain-containing protein [Candidatus Eremiobacteraeota bacterium]|nr:carboxypeptidase-like regulatory domain-containing protein [Candidatus Eremiobacteraeota bacterium]
MIKHFLKIATIAASLAVLALIQTGTQRAAFADASSISGKVVDAQTHQPLASVRIDLFADTTAPHPKMLAAAMSRKDGSFHLAGLSGGQYRLELSKMGYMVQLLTGLAVNPSQRTIIGEPIALYKASQEYSEKMACNKLVRPEATADVYIVCAGR